MAIQLTSFYQEIKDIVARGGNGTIGRWTATFLANGEEVLAEQVVSFRQNANYMEFFAAETTLSFMMTGKKYRDKLYRHRRNLMVKMTFTPTTEVGETDKPNRPIELYEYRVIPMDETDQTLSAGTIAETNPKNIDLGSLREYAVQLLPEAVYQIRLKQIGGIFVGHKTADIVRSVLTVETAKVKVADDQRPLGVDMIPADNNDVRDHVIIEHGLRLVDFPKYAQRQLGGIYTTGLGAFYHKRHWYVFPLFDVSRFEKSKRTLTIANVPSREFPHQERTYKIDGGHIYIVATGDTAHVDRTERDQLNEGIGVRYMRSKETFEAFAETSKNKAVINRAAASNEYLADTPATEYTYSPVSPKRFTDNHCLEMSVLAQRRGAIVQVVWENGYSGCLHPGMPVKLLYLHGETVRSVFGVLLASESVAQHVGTVAQSAKHKTTVFLTLFVQRTEVDN